MLSSKYSGHHLPESGGPSFDIHPSEVRKPSKPHIGGLHGHENFHDIHHTKSDSERPAVDSGSIGDRQSKSSPLLSPPTSLQSSVGTRSEPSDATKTLVTKVRSPERERLSSTSAITCDESSNRNLDENSFASNTNHRLQNPNLPSHQTHLPHDPRAPPLISSNAGCPTTLPITTTTQEAFSVASSQTLNHADSAAMPSNTPPTTHGAARSGDNGSKTHEAPPSRHVMPPLTAEQHSGLEHRSPEPPALKRKNEDTARTNTQGMTSPEEHRRIDLPLRLRNKKMRPTDCLLFAATLLENDELKSTPRSPSSAKRPASMVKASESASLSESPTSPVINRETEDGRTKPRDVDVLCGRGGLINKHPGNIVYRKVVDFNKPFYQSVHKKHRILVSQSIVQSILNFGGRFLILGAKGKPWVEIGFKRAVQKTSQALRERSGPQDDDQNAKDDEDHDAHSGDHDDESHSDDGENLSNDGMDNATQSSYPKSGVAL